uniref:Uncharacterized protein n=1 Tax=Oryza sativa subsp. japonica TaxID=39947 RepID=Q7XHS2_ORYSJ|nr:hypothetical protein [Oryza sativa Japonica Group]
MMARLTSQIKRLASQLGLGSFQNRAEKEAWAWLVWHSSRAELSELEPSPSRAHKPKLFFHPYT